MLTIEQKTVWKTSSDIHVYWEW